MENYYLWKESGCQHHEFEEWNLGKRDLKKHRDKRETFDPKYYKYHFNRGQAFGAVTEFRSIDH